MSCVARNKRFCASCRSALWQADRTRIRRFALAEYIKKYLNGAFDFFIADEVHQLKGGSTAQGNSFGALAAASKKTIALTGTLLGGYADDIFYILYRLSPESMLKENIAYSHLSRWMARYGVLERITRTYPQDNICSRGRKGSTTQKRKPGVSPMVFSNHLLGKCAFLHLEDIALDLPPISEEVIQVRMDGLLEAAYLKLEQDLLKAVREALARGSKALLGTYLNSLLSYPDRPFNNEVIYEPNSEREEIIAAPEELPQDILYAKEQQLLELVKEELLARRKVFVYCQYTQTKDITARIKTLLVSEGIKAEVLKSTVAPEGIKAEVLKSTVAPEGREDWLKNQCKSGTQVLIANPRLVETGLDLYDFPTLVFYQTGYSIFTLRQASRRSWRIGQRNEVKIYYMFYQRTMQEKAMQLMGAKLEASLAIEGKFSDEGLLAMTSGEDLTTAMAKALVEDLDNYSYGQSPGRRPRC
jgi:SNF2 family DNA or RNA helicase